MYSTIIFDLDGTLLNTLNDLAASTNYALRQSGMPERTIEEVRRFVGNGVRKLIERAVPEGEDNPLFEETFATFKRHYLEHNMDTTCPYEGVGDDTVMEALRRLGVDKTGAVYVGDSDVDLMTARNSGLPCISVLWGFRDKEFLLQHGATTFIEKPEELSSVVNSEL